MKPENRFDCNKDLCPSQGSTQFFTTKEDINIKPYNRTFRRETVGNVFGVICFLIVGKLKSLL